MYVLGGFLLFMFVGAFILHLKELIKPTPPMTFKEVYRDRTVNQWTKKDK